MRPPAAPTWAALTTGTVDGNLVDLNATSNGVEGALLNAVGGTLTVTGQVDIATTGASAGLRIVNAPANASFTFSGGVVSSSANNAAVSLDNNNAAGVVVNLGIVTLTGNTGLLVTNSPMTLGGTTGTISTTNGPAISATNSVLGASATLASVSSSNSGVEAINLVSVSGNLTMNGGSLTNATGTTFAIGGAAAGSGGASNVTYAGTITDDLGTLVNVRNATGGTKLFSGAITDGNDGDGNGISLTGNTGATINFTGGLTLSTGANAAFTATGGGTVSITGSSNTVSTTSATVVNIANTVIGGAGVTWRSVTSTGASGNVAIVLSSTGAGPFSVTGLGAAAGSGGTISNKSVDAVQLNTTGGLVTLNHMVIEDIGTMTGAIDTRSGHDAIQGLNVNAGLSLTGTILRRISDQAIHGGTQDPVLDVPTVWNGLTLTNVTVENTNRYHVANVGDANNESTVRILGLRGTASITGSTFTLGAQPLDLEVTAGTLNLTVTGNTFDRSYKEFTTGTRASVGNHCVDVRALAGTTANITIGDRANAALANTFINCRLGSIRVVNQPGAGTNTDAIIARNTFRVNDHSSGIGGDFDFPMGGVLVWNLSSGSTDTIVENNLFELVTNASGGVGQLTLIAEGGPVEALVQNNTFDRPGNAPWWVQSRNSAASVMTAQFVGNTVIRGAFPCTTDPSCGGGYFAPGLRALADANTGGTLNFTMQNNIMARHDTGFDPGQTVEVRALNSGAAPTVCASFTGNQAPDGYSLEHFLGTFRTVGAGSCAAGSPSPTCQTVLQGNSNLGGAGVGTTSPPFVNVVGTVTVSGAACPVPTGAPF
jgi:hypothetical protein